MNSTAAILLSHNRRFVEVHTPWNQLFAGDTSTFSLIPLPSVPAAPIEGIPAVRSAVTIHPQRKRKPEAEPEQPVKVMPTIKPFVRTETIQQLEQIWKEKRKDLTRDYKRKHKDAMRRVRKMTRYTDTLRVKGTVQENETVD